MNSSLLPGLTQRDLELRQRALIARAREDVNTFVTLVLRDPTNGKRLRNVPHGIHQQWHELAERHDRLMLFASRSAGKTSQLAIARVVWLLGRNPNLRVAIVCNTSAQAAERCDAISKLITTSPAVHEIFPGLLPGEPWTSTRLHVQRTMVDKNASVLAFGVHGSVQGGRVDLLILDDILDFENTRTPHARKDLWDWYHATVVGMLTPDARVINVSTAWHREDFCHEIIKVPGWRAAKFPAVIDGVAQYPFTEERVARLRAEFGSLEFARQYLCEPRSNEDAIFKQEWIDACKLRGEGRTLRNSLTQWPEGARCYTGVDLAVEKHSAADLTVLFTVMVHRDGDREIVGCESGRWSGPEILERAASAHRRYGSTLIVENNAAQAYLLQFLRQQPHDKCRCGELMWPVRGYTTTAQNKMSPEYGVQSIGVELEQGRWIIPSQGGVTDPEVDAWIVGLLNFDPRTHTSDHVMASFFAREGARQDQVMWRPGRAHERKEPQGSLEPRVPTPEDFSKASEEAAKLRRRAERDLARSTRQAARATELAQIRRGL